MLALLAVAILGVAGLFLFGGRIDLAGYAARRATASLGRQVTIGALHVSPGRWLHVELDDAKVANLPGGTKPDMAVVHRLTAEIEAVSVLHGPLSIRNAKLDGLRVLLEHVGKDGIKNWKFGAASSTAGPGAGDKPQTVVGKDDRSSFPYLASLQAHNATVVFRTSGGNPLVTKLGSVALHTAGPDAPVQLDAQGTYNDNPVTLSATMQSFSQFRQSAKPFGVKVRMGSHDTILLFDGAMTDPLNADGAVGAIDLHAPTPGPLLAIAGSASDAAVSLDLAGPFSRHGPEWDLRGAHGKLGGNTINSANLHLTEGAAGQPDKVAANIAFESLDVDELAKSAAGGTKKPAGADVPLSVDRDPDTLIEAVLATKTLNYNKLNASAVKIAASVEPGKVAMKTLSFTALGTKIDGSASITAAKGGGLVAANVRAAGADIATLRTALGFGVVPITGKLDATIAATGTADTLNTAVQNAHISAVLSMKGGTIQRRVIELASTDVRLLFRKAEGSTPVSCLLGVLDMQGGVGTLGPVRVRAAEGTIRARGSFDLNRKRFDLLVSSRGSTTSAYALDIPVLVSGTFANPVPQPAKLSATGRSLMAALDVLGPVPAPLAATARASPCFRTP